MIVYAKIPKESLNEFSKARKVNINEYIVFLYASNEQLEVEIKI